MSDDYVEWDVHATTDAFTPRVEYDDPLQQFSESESQYYSSYNNTGQLNSTSDGIESIAISSPPLPPIIPSSSSPILDSLDSLPKTSPSPQSQQSSNLKRNGSPSVPIAPPPAAAAVEVELLPMTITISDAKKQENPQGAYVTYLVTTTTSVETFSVPNPRSVRRRYQDFVWLHTALTLEYPACIVPPLPEKHRLEYIKGDRFSPEFIKRRQISLQWFLDRLSRHPYLQKSQCTRIFLESTDFRNDKRSQIRHIPQSSSIFDTLSDTLVNAFAKIRKPDEKFEEMKELVGKLEDNLNIVERLYMRINKRQQDLQNDYTNFATSLQGLSSLESNITNSLHQFAETSKAYSKAMQEMTEKEEMQFLNEIHALLAYCSAAKEVLKARDQKQLDFEELSNYLQQTIHERERTQFPGRKYNDRGGSVVGGGMQITEYVTDKINEVRGVNMEKLRREKLSNLERRINELREEVTKANDESNGFSSQVVKEFEVFQKTKTLELKQGLIAYADCHIAFYEKGTAIWANILPVLENIDGVKGDGNSTDAAQL